MRVRQPDGRQDWRGWGRRAWRWAYPPRLAAVGGFTYIDLDTPLFFAEGPFDGGYVRKTVSESIYGRSALTTGIWPRSRPDAT